MARKRNNENGRTRRVVAQEAARIIVNHGVSDYRAAKHKAAERLGVSAHGALPGNTEIENAVIEHLQIFGGESQQDHLRLLRVAALSVMEMLAEFSPRLVGPVLAGTANENSAVNLHVFADSAEIVAEELATIGVNFRPYERRLKYQRDRAASHPGFEFHHNGNAVETTVFPVDGIRQAPMSPVDGRPMKRADQKAVQGLLEHV